MGIIYEKKQKINGYECTCNYQLQPTAAELFSQQTSQEQSEQLGVGPEVLDEMGLAWFLVKYKLQFHEYRSLTMRSWWRPRPSPLINSPPTAVYDQPLDGRMMVEGDTEWMLQNRRENRLERLSNVPELTLMKAAMKTMVPAPQEEIERSPKFPGPLPGH